MEATMRQIAQLFTLAVALALPTYALAGEHAGHDHAAGAAKASDTKASTAKAGDAVYVCGCGASCQCGTVKSSPGSCSCGQPLTKTTILRVEGDQVVVKPDGKTEQKFKAP
jgi:hypothetical protein